MALEMKPLGNLCNLACTYCYQEPMRNAGNVRVSHTYDLDLMMEIADKKGDTNGYTLFGGEALLLPKKDLEYLCKASYEKYGKSGLQSNGSLIDAEHIEIFKKYNVGIGISIDGANELNSLRVPASKRKSVDELTAKTMENIMKLTDKGIDVGIIITVHKLNGTKEQLPRLIKFIEWLYTLGINSGNIHMMEIDSLEAKIYSLNSEENTEAFLELAKFFSDNPHLRWKPFTDIKRMQGGDNSTSSCVFQSCDALNTQAVFGIEADGQLSNCGMANKEGIEWTKAVDPHSDELTNSLTRDYILYNTEPEHGGCKGCPFFLMCNGYCVGSSLNGDWRNKTVNCKTLKGLFSYYEEEWEGKGLTPFSKRADRYLLEKAHMQFVLEGAKHKQTFDSLESNKPKIQVHVQVGDDK